HRCPAAKAFGYPSVFPSRGAAQPLAPRPRPTLDCLRLSSSVLDENSANLDDASALPPDRLEIAEELRVGVEHQRRVVADRLVALERLEERIELRILAERLAVDAGRLRVGLADDLLRAPLGLRADAPQLPLHIAEDLLAAAFAFRA